jgi:hypothetical protein
VSDKLIFPEWLLCHYTRGFQCERCRATGHVVTLLYPQVVRRGTTVTLIYPVRCPCGGAGSVTLEMPLALFGLALAHVALIETHQRQGSKASLAVAPRESKIAGNVVADHERMLDEFRKQSGPGRLAKPATGQPTAPPKPSHPYAGTSPTGPLCTELLSGERFLFPPPIYKESVWAEFLRRLGLQVGETPGPPEPGEGQ